MKWIFNILLLVLVPVNVCAQAPEKMSYQAVIRDNSQTLITNSDIDLRIIVRRDSPKGASVYQETHRVSTNHNGLVSFEIGTGSIEKGSFNKINWAHGSYFIESLIDPDGNSNYTIKTINQMLSVPYALHAKSVDEFTGSLNLSQINDLNFEINGNETVYNNWDKDVNDDFSGDFYDLQNLPALYTADEVDDLLTSIAINEGKKLNLILDGKILTISNGNSISFENWDTNTDDDFSGAYDDLKNKPELFSGLYNDLINRPELYDKKEIDNLIEGIEATGEVSQNLSLEKSTLSISGGNAVSFNNWDTNVADDFSGVYDDLQNKPELYYKAEIDKLFEGIETTKAVSQNLNLNQTTLSISEGNSISFENWDTDVDDDFDGKYSSLTGLPKVYTQKEVDNISAEILKDVEKNYTKKAKVLALNSSRNINMNDIGNTLACNYSSTLTINSGFSAMEVEDVINLEAHGTTLTVKGASGVIINGKYAGNAIIGNDKVYTGGIIRKISKNSYIIL